MEGELHVQLVCKIRVISLILKLNIIKKRKVKNY